MKVSKFFILALGSFISSMAFASSNGGGGEAQVQEESLLPIIAPELDIEGTATDFLKRVLGREATEKKLSRFSKAFDRYLKETPVHAQDGHLAGGSETSRIAHSTAHIENLENLDLCFFHGVPHGILSQFHAAFPNQYVWLNGVLAYEAKFMKKFKRVPGEAPLKEKLYNPTEGEILKSLKENTSFRFLGHFYMRLKCLEEKLTDKGDCSEILEEVDHSCNLAVNWIEQWLNSASRLHGVLTMEFLKRKSVGPGENYMSVSTSEIVNALEPKNSSVFLKNLEATYLKAMAGLELSEKAIQVLKLYEASES